MTYSSWNTLAQEQPNLYADVVNSLGSEYQIVPMATMEPTSLTQSYIERGDYQLDYFQPTDQFFDDYMIISLPQFFLLDEDNIVRGVIVGPNSPADLVVKIKQIYGV
jgi:hypothetical protein